MNKEIEPALDEIGAVLKKHDMAGLVIIGNATHCDWRMEVSASWSCAQKEPHPNGGDTIRIKAKRADYPSDEAQKKTVERTIGMFVTFDHTLTHLQKNLEKLLIAISGQVNFLGKSTDES